MYIILTQFRIIKLNITIYNSILKKFIINNSNQFEVSETDSNDLNLNLIIFLNYAIKQKEFSFKSSEIIGELKLPILPSVFGKLLRQNLDKLEKKVFILNQKELVLIDYIMHNMKNLSLKI